MSIEKKDSFRKIVNKGIDGVFLCLLGILALKKGGFYKADSLFFQLGLHVLVVLHFFVHLKKDEKVRKKENKMKGILLFLSVVFIFPILFKNVTSLNDAIFEMIRYFDVFLIYEIVHHSENKKSYKIGIILVALLLCLLGIDQIANGYCYTVLSYFRSGYLTTNQLDRMSSTIQYANVFALICVMALFLNQEERNQWRKDSDSKQKSISYLIEFILLASIVLSGSRMVILLLSIFFFLESWKEKRIPKGTIGIIVLTVMYVSSIHYLIQSNLNAIYFTTICWYGLVFFLFNWLYKNENWRKEKVNHMIKRYQESSKKYVWWIFIGIGIVCMIMIGNLKRTVLLNASSNRPYLTKNIYQKDIKDNNLLEIQIDELEEDTRYEIEVFQVDKNHQFVLEKKWYYYHTVNGKFELEMTPIEDIQYINMNIHCTKGSLKVSKIVINQKEIGKNRIFLPSNLIDRVKEGMYTQNSSHLRFVYSKDALKIATSHLKNLLFGIGGEGFKNEYSYVKSEEYYSTEVHQIYLQIFVESGIFGLFLLLLLMWYGWKNYKLDGTKKAWLFLIIHGLFDLDFSYMVVLAIFAILLGLLKEKEEILKKNPIKKAEMLTRSFLAIFLFCITSVFLTSAYFSNNIKVYEISQEDSLVEIGKKLNAYEKKVTLDRLEPSYRIELNEGYRYYLASLQTNIKQEKTVFLENEYQRVRKAIKNNLAYLEKNEARNPTNLIDVSNQIYYFLDELAEMYSQNKEEGYVYYLSQIYHNMSRLLLVKDAKWQEKGKNMCQQYAKGLNHDSPVCQKYQALLLELSK